MDHLANSPPAFSLTASRYDMHTFQGRLQHFFQHTNPMSLFTSKENLDRSIILLREFENGRKIGSDEELWTARWIKEAIIHPDTGNKIFAPFRMSGFVPFGSPIVVGLLLPNQALPAIAFWQWLNQSHNACVNFANRNASKPTATFTFVQGYMAAVGSACSIAISLSVIIRKAQKFSPATRTVIERFIPFPAVATASTLNLFFMRRHEMKTGVKVYDSQGNVVGESQVAAKQALLETAVTRFILPAPILLIPPICISLLDRTSFFIKFPRMNIPMNAALVVASFGLALPTCLALFPHESSISRDRLEAKIQEKTDELTLFYNKGL